MERDITGEVSEEMEAASFKFLTDKAQPEHPSSKGILFIGADGLNRAGGFLHDGLCGNREAKLDICLDLASVKRGIEIPEFDRMGIPDIVEV